jgi:hypothetical protein
MAAPRASGQGRSRAAPSICPCPRPVRSPGEPRATLKAAPDPEARIQFHVPRINISRQARNDPVRSTIASDPFRALEIVMRRFVLATLAVAALSGPVFAADNAPPTVAPKFETVPQDAVLSYNLIGLNVTDAQNNTVGEIKDLVIDHEKLAGYIVSVGGFLGLGERYVAVSPASIALGYDADAKKWKAIIGASKDQLKSAPEFKYDGKFKR